MQHFVGFVYREVRLHCSRGQAESIAILVEPHRGIAARCSRCRWPAPGYDHLPERRWLFVPLRGIPTYFRYAPRRVECAEHGVVVEQIPWSDGKRPLTCTMMVFLARWAKRLSWRETANVFRTSWEAAGGAIQITWPSNAHTVDVDLVVHMSAWGNRRKPVMAAS